MDIEYGTVIILNLEKKIKIFHCLSSLSVHQQNRKSYLCGVCVCFLGFHVFLSKNHENNLKRSQVCSIRFKGNLFR